MNYDVTIGIPVYQAEAFLSRSLESALGQQARQTAQRYDMATLADQWITLFEKVKG